MSRHPALQSLYGRHRTRARSVSVDPNLLVHFWSAPYFFDHEPGLYAHAKKHSSRLVKAPEGQALWWFHISMPESCRVCRVDCPNPPRETRITQPKMTVPHVTSFSNKAGLGQSGLPTRLIEKRHLCVRKFTARVFRTISFGGALLLLACLHLRAAEIRLFAAASLSDALKEIATQYERRTGDKIRLNTGASSTLARQIEAGAQADIFFSADEAKMDLHDAKGLIANETRKAKLSNTLAIVVAIEQGAAIASPNDLATSKVKRIALGDPETVPIGIYARSYLERLNLWKAVRSKVVPTESVRAALAAVEGGDADASIVYNTDALISKKVKVAYRVPKEEGPRICYPIALVRNAREPQAAAKFLEHLNSEDAAKIFRKFGFIVIDAPRSP